MKNSLIWLLCMQAMLLAACQQQQNEIAAGDSAPNTGAASVTADQSSDDEAPVPPRVTEPAAPPLPAPPVKAPASGGTMTSGSMASSASRKDSGALTADGIPRIVGNVAERFTIGAKSRKLASATGGAAVGYDAAKSAQAGSHVVARKAPDFQKIKAELAADSVITTPGNPGDLAVWVGDPAAKANFAEDKARASAVIDTSITPTTVKIKPVAPAFTATPESVCTNFDPTGTTVHFELTPNLERAGKFKVGAGVWLYDSGDCSGTPSPKDAPELEVEVVVRVVPDDMLKTVREGISKFWAELVGLTVALLVFFARNFLKKLFGFDGK